MGLSVSAYAPLYLREAIELVADVMAKHPVWRSAPVYDWDNDQETTEVRDVCNRPGCGSEPYLDHIIALLSVPRP